MSFFEELKRRNVVRVGIAYGVGAWLLLQLAEVLVELLDLPGEIGPVVVAVVIIGFPIVLFAAWAFELTPEGIKREKEVDRTASITPTTGRKLDRAIIVLLLVAVAYLATDKFLLEREPAATETETAASDESPVTPTIAVLPLADMSAAGDNEYFSDGLTEELLNILSKIRELQVAGRTSSFAFKGRNQDLREIGQKLNVAHILEGSVRKDDANNRVRITLQLIDAESGFNLWSETYDRNLEDIFALQEEIAHEVASALRVTLLGEDEARLDALASTTPGTYDRYLQGRKELAVGGYVHLEQARDLFQQVLAEDPVYVPARLALVETWTAMARTGAITIHEAVERSLPQIDPILEKDPDNGLALRLKADLHRGSLDWETAEHFYVRALDVDPRDAQALTNYGRFLYDRREVERGVALMDEAVAIEPYDPRVLWDTCQTSGHLGRLEKALKACRRIQELEPSGPQGYYGEAVAWLYQGRLPESMREFIQAIERDPEDYEMLAAMAAFWSALGEPDLATPWLERAEAIGAGQPFPLYVRALFFENNEQYERAVEIAQGALERQLDDRQGTNFFFRRTVAAHAMRTGEYAQGLENYRALLPWAFEAELVIPNDAVEFFPDVVHVAALMQAADPLSTRPEALLAFAEANTDVIHPAWGQRVIPLQQAMVRAVTGDRDGALEALERVANHGVNPYWRQDLLEEPAFHGLHGDPGYETIVADYEAAVEQQRIEARTLLEIDS
ncbi:MAG: tetratricopeptide repeat protein [Xanthomonadales bacterium]|jgi:TolB-like protein/Tfp pilus assembly protein PilF|nr:tetratricopeptide repeat protein [Xanthomonadales bacterium]